MDIINNFSGKKRTELFNIISRALISFHNNIPDYFEKALSELQEKKINLSPDQLSLILNSDLRIERSLIKILFNRMVIKYPRNSRKEIYEMCKKYYPLFPQSGLHWGVPPIVIKYLINSYNLLLECYASPINSTCKKFCSLFPETDAPFGSLGRFDNLLISEILDLEPEEKQFSIEINPPFIETIMDYATDRIIEILHAAQESHKDIIIFYLTPHWTDTRSFIKIHPFCRNIICFNKLYSITMEESVEGKKILPTSDFDFMIFYNGCEKNINVGHIERLFRKH